jgi:hypothetical protein
MLPRIHAPTSHFETQSTRIGAVPNSINDKRDNDEEGEDMEYARVRRRRGQREYYDEDEDIDTAKDASFQPRRSQYEDSVDVDDYDDGWDDDLDDDDDDEEIIKGEEYCDTKSIA